MNQPTTDTTTLPDFRDLAIIPPVLLALKDVGYEAPSPIQALTIPHILAGRDIVGQAQTGTGKTAAFALPLLSTLDLDRRAPQVLVLTPTRELAIQVAEAFQRYAGRLPGFHVLPIYGGQDYRGQLRQLKQGVHVVVGTPGRVMDHMRRGTLKLDDLRALVLDEADEMLRMGFIEDVEWILEQSPPERQVALFSATLPREIRRIAAKHLKNPEEITVAVRTTTAECIRQRYWMVSGMHKLDALTRILEAEEFEAMIVFVRTKIATVELAEKLAARGYNAAALNGDLQQKQRELIIERLRSGKIEILVATDVAARGLDVDRISHVINYDIPCDTEAYVHRIGRTGRFGRNGDAILFIAPREKHLLYAIEKATRQKITLMELPSTEMINNQRINRFTQQITDRLAKNNLEFFNQLIEQYQHEHNVPAIEIAAALASLIQGETPMLLDKVPNEGKKERQERSPRREGRDSRHPERGSAHDKRDPGKPRDPDSRFSKPRQQRLDEPRQGKRKPEPSTAPVKAGLERYRLEVGKQHGVRPENIVGAIANEAGLDSRFIDRITIHETFSTVDLPEGMPRDVYRDLKKVWVAGRQLNINRMDADAEVQSPKKRRS
ncbi:MAG: DEAD/DEAH box helicase [Gammaproteobacteria bacterium]|jgi:ATP-dependent RNA helicase DeaD|nr:MAG: DEAD/DEAH box helicase [Gammaproteobacteria bacterium]